MYNTNLFRTLVQRIKFYFSIYNYAEIVIEVADDPNIVLIEQAVYPFSTFIADVGGAFGLALGLSVMGILKTSCLFCIVRKLFSF